MKKIRFLLFSVIFIIFFSRCASSKSQNINYYGGEDFLSWTPRLEAQNKSEAQVIVTRLDNKGGYIGIFINNTFAGKLGDGQTGYYELKTNGIHEIRAKYDKMTYSMNSKNIERSYRIISPLTDTIEFFNKGDQHNFYVRYIGSKRIEGPNFYTGDYYSSIEHEVELSKDDITVISSNHITTSPAIIESFRILSRDIPENAPIAIINIISDNLSESIQIIDELTFIFVNAKHFVVDRDRLQVILDEQHFQMSGYVDDNAMVSIGHFTGANVILTGSINVINNRKRLAIRALDVLTSKIIAMSLVDM